MDKNTAEDTLKEPVDLPQIRFPIRGTKTAAEQAADQADMDKLGKVVEAAFSAIANANGISEKEVLHVIKDTRVEMLKDVLKDRINVDVLKEGIQEAIKHISLATGLDTGQISAIFTARKDASLNDIVSLLHHKGIANKEKFGN